MYNDSATRKESDRRTFLSYVIFALGGFITAALGIPIVGAAIAPTLKARQANWVSAGSIGDFPQGQPKAAQVTIVRKDGWIQNQEPKGIWVIKNSDADFSVFSGRCVHLGCAFNWVAQSKEFECPCHGGKYTLDGKVVAGPPPRPLDTLNWRIDQGTLMVEYADFRLGIPQKEAV